MSEQALLQQLADGTADFADVISHIDTHYDFQPTAFRNGDTYNDAGTNNGSCKIFAFGKLKGLSPQQTLNAFGDYYRKDVLQNPEGSDHANIRNFIQHGWEGIDFEGEALTARS
ncbi:MAG: HopJ type III effector protein [Spongiibacter sp.]|uniref:HopJ type III effector protein n=1 Tax=Spongiibacter TaxID=630749 RepID=UPI001B281ED2|nr:HopJ type III effector protein [Spongiibacter sp.]MBO6754383.1 HopJ type III effector protein [Spongiibacter sp.]